MKNIIKAELHKIFHSGYFYAFPCALAVILLISYVNGGGSGGIGQNPDRNMHHVMNDTMELIIFAVAAAGIFMVYLWNKERKNGYIKNIAGNVNGKHILTLSKLITGAVVTTIYSFVTFLFSLGFNLISCLRDGGKLIYDMYSADEMALIMERISTLSAQKQADAIKVHEETKSNYYYTLNTEYLAFFVWIVTGIAIIAILLMLHELFRSAAVGYIMALQFLGGIFEGLIAQVVLLVFEFEGIMGLLLLRGTQDMLSVPIYVSHEAMSTYQRDSVLEALLRSAMYMAVFSVFSVFISRKKDV